MKKNSKPQVEITGLEAKFYDFLLNTITLGQYSRLIQKAISEIPLNSEEIVMDLGAGTGKNSEIFLELLGPQSKIYALEIGEEMRQQIEKRQQAESRLLLLNQRIEQPFLLPETATVAFISFVIHGLQQESRLKVIENVYQNLESGGKFCILDYNHFAVDSSPWYVRFAIQKLECEPTENFIQQDWPKILHKHGFESTSEKYYFRNYLRLLCAYKK